VPHDRPCLTETDHRRLRALLDTRAGTDAVADVLAEKLARAEVVPACEIEPDVATIDARLAYRLGTERLIHRRTLVLPQHYAPTGSCLSVLSPLGAALLGMRAGSDVSCRDRSGTAVPAVLIAVEWQPKVHAFPVSH
jgi:regulator of nucleoside diphosphate kinase